MRLSVLLFCAVGTLAQPQQCDRLPNARLYHYMGKRIGEVECWETTCDGDLAITFASSISGTLAVVGDTTTVVDGGVMDGVTRTVPASGLVTITASITHTRTNAPSPFPCTGTDEACRGTGNGVLTNYVHFFWECIDPTAPETNTKTPVDTLTPITVAPHTPTTDAPQTPTTDAPHTQQCDRLPNARLYHYMGKRIGEVECWETTCDGDLAITFASSISGTLAVVGDTTTVVDGGVMDGVTRTVPASGLVTITASITHTRTNAPSPFPCTGTDEACRGTGNGVLTNYVHFFWECIDPTAPETNTKTPVDTLTPITVAPHTQQTSSPLTPESPSSVAAVWCSSDAQCQEHGDTSATCEQNGHCTCGDGFVKPFDAASGRRAHICVTSETRVSDVVHATFDVACDGSSGKGARVAEIVVDLVGGTVTDVREECGSLNVFVSVSDMPLLDVAAMDVAARLSENVQASDLGLGDVLSAGLASVDDLQCPTVPGVSEMSFIAGECVPQSCSIGYTRASTGNVIVCVVSTTVPLTTAPTTSTPDSGSSGLSTGAIVGICVGAGVVLIVAIVVAVCLLKKKKDVNPTQTITNSAPDAVANAEV